MNKKLILQWGLFITPFYYFRFFLLKKYPGRYHLDIRPGELNFLSTGQNFFYHKKKLRNRDKKAKFLSGFVAKYF